MYLYLKEWLPLAASTVANSDINALKYRFIDVPLSEGMVAPGSEYCGEGLLRPLLPHPLPLRLFLSSLHRRLYPETGLSISGKLRESFFLLSLYLALSFLSFYSMPNL